MKIPIIFLTTIILLLSIISAVTIYSGESITLELEKSYAYYSVVGNSTEVILDITQDGNFVTITPDKYSLNDSYEVVFFDTEKETITVYQSSGGGGGGTTTKWKTEYVDKNVTSYVDKEIIKEVPGETMDVEKIVKSSKWWLFLWAIIGLVVGFIAYGLMFDKNSNIDIRRYENNE